MSEIPHDFGLIVKVDESSDITSTGIYVPEIAKEQSLCATVVEVGSGIEDIKVGDMVVFAKGTVKELDSGLHFLPYNPQKMIVYEC